MTLKKKITALALVVSIIALMTAAGTLAYFKDTEGVVNVFTAGHVDIELHEDNGLNEGDAGYKLDDDYRDWVADQDFVPTVTLEKDAWVTNVGTENAYVRVFVLYPAAIAPMLEVAYDNDTDWADATDEDGNVISDIVYVYEGVEYTGRCLVYVADNGILAPGASTTDTVTSVYFDKNVENTKLANGSILYTLGDAAFIDENGDFPVFVIAQAGQVINQLGEWDNANDALNVMFGVPGAEGSYPFGETTIVSDQSELAAAAKDAVAGDTIILATGEYDLKGCQVEGVTYKGVGNVRLANTTKFAGNSGMSGALVDAMSFNNVTFTNTVFTMSENGKADFTFTNVTFEGGVRNAYADTVVFDGCTFYENAEGYALHYAELTADDSITVTDCSFVTGRVAFGGEGLVTLNGCDFSNVVNSTKYQTQPYVGVWTSMKLTECVFAEATVIDPNGETVTLTDCVNVTLK